MAWFTVQGYLFPGINAKYGLLIDYDKDDKSKRESELYVIAIYLCLCLTMIVGQLLFGLPLWLCWVPRHQRKATEKRATWRPSIDDANLLSPLQCRSDSCQVPRWRVHLLGSSTQGSQLCSVGFKTVSMHFAHEGGNVLMGCCWRSWWVVLGLVNTVAPLCCVCFPPGRGQVCIAQANQ